MRKSLAPSRAKARATPADRATGAVDHRNFAVQHQYQSFLSPVVTCAQLMS